MAEQSNEFWGDVTAVAATPVALAAGFAKGTLDAASGHGPFLEGFSEAANPIITAAKRFGSHHGDTITRGLVGGAATALGARIISGGLRHLKR